MLTAVILVAIFPAFLILGLGIVTRAVAAQRVTAPVVHFAPERGSTVLRDALLANADGRAASAALIDLVVKRKARLLTNGSKRDPIGIEMMPNVVLTSEEIALLEALFGPEHTHTRVRRFSSERRALAARLRTVVQNTEHALARDGLVARRRVTWPGMTLTVLAYLGMLVEALFLVFSLFASDWPALIATIIAVVATVATILVTPSWWRRFLPPAQQRREHLEGLRQYLVLAESERMRVLQSPSGAEVVASGAEPGGRFHLHERLLPYAVLFGVEREWIAKLRLEHDALDQGNADTLGEAVDVTAEVALAFDAAGGALELTAAVGDLFDIDGDVLDSVSGIFEIFHS